MSQLSVEEQAQDLHRRLSGSPTPDDVAEAKAFLGSDIRNGLRNVLQGLEAEKARKAARTDAERVADAKAVFGSRSAAERGLQFRITSEDGGPDISEAISILRGFLDGVEAGNGHAMSGQVKAFRKAAEMLALHVHFERSQDEGGFDDLAAIEALEQGLLKGRGRPGDDAADKMQRIFREGRQKGRKKPKLLKELEAYAPSDRTPAEKEEWVKNAIKRGQK